MSDTENPKPQNSDDAFAGLSGGETSYAEQKIIAPIVDDSLAQLAENGADAGDITQVTSMLAARGVTITPQIEALIRRKIEEAEVKKESDSGKKPRGQGSLDDELAGIRGNIAAESEGMVAEPPPPPAREPGQGADMSYFSRMSDSHKKK